MTDNGADNRQIPADWYGDPLTRGRERYWDGEAWTDETRPAQPAPLPSLPERAPAAAPSVGAPPSSGATAATPSGAYPGQWRPGEDSSQRGYNAPAADPGQPAYAGQPAWQPSAAPMPARGTALASIGQRIGSTLIDGVICFVLSTIATWNLWAAAMRRTQDYLAAHPGAGPMIPADVAQTIITPREELTMFLAWLVVGVAYGTVLLAWRGATLGQLATRTRTVPAEKLQHTGGLGAGPAFIRSLVWSLGGLWFMLPPLGLVLLFCVIPVLSRADRMGLHDRMARTQVVSQALAMPRRDIH